MKTDRGVLLSKDEHREVGDVAQELGKFCIPEPVKSPLIFGGYSLLLYSEISFCVIDVSFSFYLAFLPFYFTLFLCFNVVLLCM